MEKKFISVVVYLNNDEARIADFLRMTSKCFGENFEDFEVIAVDDECTDGTLDVIRNFVKNGNFGHMVNIVHMGFFQGVEASMNAGRDAAIGDFVFEFDTCTVDYEDDVPFKLYEKSLEGYDIVSAVSTSHKRFTSRLFYSLYNRFSHGNGKIGPESFRVISRRAINRVKSMGEHIPYRKAVYANCGLNMTSVSYNAAPGMDTTGTNITGTNNSKAGGNSAAKKSNSKHSTGRSKLAMDSFIYFTNVMEKLSAFISGMFLIITVIVGIYIISDSFSARKPVEGWLSTMAFMAFGFFGVFALLTIILKYLSVLLNLEFKKQRYLVSDIEKVV